MAAFDSVCALTSTGSSNYAGTLLPDTIRKGSARFRYPTTGASPCLSMSRWEAEQATCQEEKDCIGRTSVCQPPSNRPTASACSSMASIIALPCGSMVIALAITCTATRALDSTSRLISTGKATTASRCMSHAKNSRAGIPARVSIVMCGWKSCQRRISKRTVCLSPLSLTDWSRHKLTSTQPPMTEENISRSSTPS